MTNGLASSVWTPSGEGTVFATAIGFGIASQMFDCDGPCEPIDGPRGDSGEGDDFFDPFMAIQSQFNPNADAIPDPLEPVPLEQGELTFTFSFGCDPCSPPAASKRASTPTPMRLKVNRVEGIWPGTVSLPRPGSADSGQREPDVTDKAFR